jgi:hypothetical protein
MKPLLFAVLMFICGWVLAVETQPFSFKDIPLDSKIVLLVEHPEIDCKELPAQKRVFGDKQCTYMKLGPYRFPESKFRTFGGATIEAIIMNYYDDTLKKIFVSVKPDGFYKVVSALREKYGPPYEEKKETIQTKMGALYENEIIRWRQGASTLKAEKYFGNVSTSAIMYEMDDYSTEGKRRMQERSKQGASDL